MAPLANALDTLSLLGISLLAVIGGAVAGAILTAIIVWLICWFFYRRQPPQPVRVLLRWLGAIAGALLVASYLTIGPGGTGWLFGEGGLGPGLGGEKSPGEKTPEKDAIPPPSKADEMKSKSDVEPPRMDRVRIEILGGELVKVPNYYRIEGEQTAVDLKGVREHIQRLEQASTKFTGVDILIYRNSLYSNSEPVKQLEALIADLGQTPNLVKLNSDIPP